MNFSELTFQAIEESSPHSIILVNSEGIIKYTNNQAGIMFGYNKDELTNQNVSILIPDKFSISHLNLVNNFFQDPLNISIRKGRELSGIRKDKTEIPVEICLNPIKYENRNFVFATITDISERKQFEKSINDAFRFNTTILDSTPIGIIAYNKDGFVLSANESAAEIIGTTVDNLKLQNFYNIDSWKKSGILEEATFTLENRFGRIKEVEFTTTFGKEIYLSYKFEYFEYNEKAHLLFRFEDITERKKTELALLNSEQVLFEIFEFSPIALMIAKLSDGEILMVNKSLLKLTDFTKNEIIGHLTSEFYPVLNYRNEIIKDLLLNNQLRNKELIFKNKNGSLIEVIVSSEILELNGEKVILSAIQDVTAKSKRTKELRVYKLAFDFASDGKIITDANSIDNPIIFANKSFLEITGYTLDEIIGKNCRFLQGEDTNHETIKNIRETLEQNKDYFGEILNYKKDGTPFWNLLHINPIFDEKGILTHFLGIQRDISAKKKADEALQKFTKYESLSILAAGMAHNFNNILGGIMLNTEMLKVKLDAPDKFIANIKKGIDQAHSLASKFQNFSKESELIKDKKLIDGVIDDSIAIALEGSPIKVIKQYFHTNLVQIDEKQINEVLMNLFINAKQAMSNNGKIEITTKEIGLTNDINYNQGDYLQIEIKDNGSGISQENLRKIFEPFFTTKKEGNGLGLSSCYYIIKKHNGYITVDSELGVGTTFIILLPIIN